MEFYKVKITRKGTKPPIWRRCLVPADITFAQMAVVLEEILEYETSSLYEFEFFQKKVRIREWTEDGESATWQYDFQNAADTFVNDLMNTEKWFTFRIHAEEKLPEYRVDIENRVKKAVLDEGDKEVCFPVIMKEVSREDEEIWTDALERNAYLEETFKLQDGESDYRSFEEIKADTESNKILITSTKPVSRELHNKQSTDSIMREFTDNYLNPFIEQKMAELELEEEGTRNPDVKEYLLSYKKEDLEEKAKEFKDNIKDTNTRVLSGMDGLIEAATLENADLVVNSVVGMVGLKPTLAAANAKKDIAFANKETLVTGGKLVCDAVKKNGVKLLPVDSEHSAIFQCLQGMPEKKMLKKLILTASGGPFFGKTVEDLKNVTVNEALNHPNWSMGAKITIDSATMMNKGLEIIEARWLFDVQPENIDVVVHRESIIHSLIEYVDNSVIAQLGLPDMRIPIQYAITYPERYESPVGELSLAQIGKMTFFEPDYDTFKCLRACKKALSLGGVATAIANGANEEANRLFREGKITFLEIGDLVMGAIDNIDNFEPLSVDDVLKADKLAREYVLSKL